MEHKSYQDARLLKQLLSYLACFYEKESSPLIPLVFYHGKNPKWNLPMDFHQSLGISSLSGRYVPNFTYKLINVHDLDIKRQARHLTSCVVLLVFQKSHREFSERDLEDFFLLLNRLPKKERIWLGEILIGYIGACHRHLGFEELAGAEKRVIKKKEECFMAEFKNIFIEEAEERGIEKGEKKGRDKERREVALKLLKEGMEVSRICNITGLSIEEIDELKD